MIKYDNLQKGLIMTNQDKMIINSQIERLKEVYRATSEAAFARKIGLSNSSVLAGWRKHGVPKARIKQAHLDTGVDEAWILTGEGVPTNEKKDFEKLKEEIEILKIENDFLKKKIEILEKKAYK
jgi:hypothetical protein